MAWRVVVPAAAVAVASQLVMMGQGASGAVTPRHTGSTATYVANFNRPSNLDCNGWGEYHTIVNGKTVTRPVKSLRPAMKGLCTDPFAINPKTGQRTRFVDNGWYVGHDEPSVKFISSAPGTGNSMAYGMQLPVDPGKAPTASGSVTKYGELSVAPWFGLPICDPLSYPQNPCTPDSDVNQGGITNAKDAGSAFMELQFYPPGFTPFMDSTSCSTTQWCAALTIDSLECSFNFKTCNNACIEPVNFSYLQTNGVPAGPPSPQEANLASYLGNAQTLKMNPGDVLKVSVTDPASGLTAAVTDITTHTTGYIQASAANGFADTSMSNCNGHPFTFHAEYSTARKANQVPWAALEGGVLMEQEIGHFESCSSVTAKMGFSMPGYTDPNVYQTCLGGTEGTTNGHPNRGEGPCNLNTFTFCRGAESQGVNGPVPCSTTNPQTGAHCEFADGFCFQKGTRSVTINGQAAKESWPVSGCTQNFAQNGDLDYDGTNYRPDWPNGSPNFPTSVRYIGPFSHGKAYPQIQFETDAPGSEALCNVATGKGCTVPPMGAKFYPFWTMNNTQTLMGLPSKPGVCVWNFGNVIRGVTTNAFGRDRQYGQPDVARYGGTDTSKVMQNPEFAGSCKTITF